MMVINRNKASGKSMAGAELETYLMETQMAERDTEVVHQWDRSITCLVSEGNDRGW